MFNVFAKFMEILHIYRRKFGELLLFLIIWNQRVQLVNLFILLNL